MPTLISRLACGDRGLFLLALFLVEWLLGIEVMCFLEIRFELSFVGVFYHWFGRLSISRCLYLTSAKRPCLKSFCGLLL